MCSMSVFVAMVDIWQVIMAVPDRPMSMRVGMRGLAVVTLMAMLVVLIVRMQVHMLLHLVDVLMPMLLSQHEPRRHCHQHNGQNQ